MSAKFATFAVLVGAVTLTSVAAAGPEAAKQRVAITAKVLPSYVAVLDPLKNGALKHDSGTFNGIWSQTPDRRVMRNGQQVSIYHPIWTFTGKRGTIVFRERVEELELGQDLNHDAFPDTIAIGTWKVVRGKGLYSGITGGGRSAHFTQGTKWVARYEGFLTK